MAWRPTRARPHQGGHFPHDPPLGPCRRGGPRRPSRGGLVFDPTSYMATLQGMAVLAREGRCRMAASFHGAGTKGAGSGLTADAVERLTRIAGVVAGTGHSQFQIRLVATVPHKGRCRRSAPTRARRGLCVFKSSISKILLQMRSWR
jgi:hypothetical protein